MKVWKTIASVVAALAAVLGIVYVVATYGDRIVAWARNLLNRCNCCCDCDCDECDCECECEECECECDCENECPCEEAAEEAVVAEQNDFEGE